MSLKRFAREAKSLAKLSHPNLHPIFDVGETESAILSIANEFDSEGSLRDPMLGEKPMTQRMYEFVSCIARRLDAAHQAGSFLCDFKPSNVLIHQPPKSASDRDNVASLMSESLQAHGWILKHSQPLRQ